MVRSRGPAAGDRGRSARGRASGPSRRRLRPVGPGGARRGDGVGPHAFGRGGARRRKAAPAAPLLAATVAGRSRGGRLPGHALDSRGDVRRARTERGVRFHDRRARAASSARVVGGDRGRSARLCAPARGMAARTGTRAGQPCRRPGRGLRRAGGCGAGSAMSVAAALQLPDTGHLEQVLGRLGEAGTVIVQRSRNVYTSSYPSEVLTCEAGDGDVRRLLCKYGPTGTSTGHGHRGGVAYEGAVYRHVLEAVGMDTPRLWGVHDERAEGRTWLVIEYLDDAERVAWHPPAMGPAATWIGRFHATMEGRVQAPELGFLSRYDGDYFAGWAARAD